MNEAGRETLLAAAASRLAQTLRTLGLRLVTAESCSGGLLAGALTEQPGASDWFERGYITYSNQSKMDCLGVAAATLATHGAVSPEVAREMALGALRAARVEVAVAITGLAGPGGATATKPVGMVCLAWACALPWAIKTVQVATRTEYCVGDRAAIRDQAVAAAIALVTQQLDQACVRHPPQA